MLTRDAIYRRLVELLPRRAEVIADLTRRGLSVSQATALPIKSIPRKGQESSELIKALSREFGEDVLRRCPGFLDKNDRLTFWSAVGRRDGYVVPYINERNLITGIQLRVFGGRYETARGARVADMYHVAGAGSPGDDLYVTEGGLKATVAATLGGVWCFGVPGQALAPEHIEAIARLEPARVIVALDREVNATTDRAREKWIASLAWAGLPTYDAVWEGEL